MPWPVTRRVCRRPLQACSRSLMPGRVAMQDRAWRQHRSAMATDSPAPSSVLHGHSTSDQGFREHAVEVDGTLYVVTGHGTRPPLDAVSGKNCGLRCPRGRGRRRHPARLGVRGLGYWNGKVYLGSFDGRLMARCEKTGKRCGRADLRPGHGPLHHGAPRLFNGKVSSAMAARTSPPSGLCQAMIGDRQAVWGSLSCRRSRQGFEDKTRRWRRRPGRRMVEVGRGGTPEQYDYDADSDTILIGTGNGDPWKSPHPRKARRQPLSICSVVGSMPPRRIQMALPIQPGESWDTIGHGPGARRPEYRRPGCKVMNDAPRTIPLRHRPLQREADLGDSVCEITWATGLI